MNKKICHWLNSNEQGNIVLRHGRIAVCCTREILLLDGENDYTQLSYDDIQNKRKEFFTQINSDNSPCEGCGFLHEIDEQNINIGKLGYIIYHPHKTCNLRCIYCPFAKSGEVLEKFDKNKYNAYNIIKHFHDIDLFKDDFTFEFGGGEPLLLEDIPEAIDLLSEYYPKSTALFVSNFTLKDKVERLIPVLSQRKIKTILKTSIDCGTPETYKKIRGQNLYKVLRNNLIKAAKSNAFDEIMLKYIFLEDSSNATKENINGFIKLVHDVKKANPNITTVIIDADQTSLFSSDFKEDCLLSNNIIAVAAKIHCKCLKLACQVKWLGERLSYSTQNGRIQIEQIEKCSYSMGLKKTILQHILSIENTPKHTVIKILGIKIKLKRHNK